jgi:ubiquinone biosynthesis monooxygenase Coq7
MLAPETILKVNHAGEFGAIRIYRAQIAVARLFGFRLQEHLHQMLAHELSHFATFNTLARQRGSRTCRALWLWSWGGYMLGLLTALFGPAGIWACTYAVERTVDLHLREQLALLEGKDELLHQAILSILADEQSHRDRAFGALRHGSFAQRIIEPIVTKSVQFAITLSHRL